MLLLPSRYATENERAWEHVISTVGKCLFQGNDGKIEEVGEQVEAEKYGRQIGRQK